MVFEYTGNSGLIIFEIQKKEQELFRGVCKIMSSGKFNNIQCS